MSATLPPAAHIAAVGLLGPGLRDWPAAAEVLAGRAAWQPAPTVLAAPQILPPAERRRTGRMVTLALTVGLEAVATAGTDAATLATVFSSSSGDGLNCHQICQALASEDRQISPTRFHNSVHNAAAGYWSIATGATAPASVLCAHDASFSAGLLEAVVQVAVERIACLLIAYDTDYPAPLRSARPVPDAFGVALLLTPEPAPGRFGRLSLQLIQACADRLHDPALEALRASIPAARSLPLLTAIARGQGGRVVLDYLDGTQLAADLAADSAGASSGLRNVAACR